MQILLVAGVAYLGTYVFALVLALRGWRTAALRVALLAIMLVPLPWLAAWGLHELGSGSGLVDRRTIARIIGLVVVPLVAPFIPLLSPPRQ